MAPEHERNFTYGEARIAEVANYCQRASFGVASSIVCNFWKQVPAGELAEDGAVGGGRLGSMSPARTEDLQCHVPMASFLPKPLDMPGFIERRDSEQR